MNVGPKPADTAFENEAEEVGDGDIDLYDPNVYKHHRNYHPLRLEQPDLKWPLFMRDIRDRPIPEYRVIDGVVSWAHINPEQWKYRLPGRCRSIPVHTSCKPTNPPS